MIRDELENSIDTAYEYAMLVSYELGEQVNTILQNRFPNDDDSGAEGYFTGSSDENIQKAYDEVRDAIVTYLNDNVDDLKNEGRQIAILIKAFDIKFM